MIDMQKVINASENYMIRNGYDVQDIIDDVIVAYDCNDDNAIVFAKVSYGNNGEVDGFVGGWKNRQEAETFAARILLNGMLGKDRLVRFDNIQMIVNQETRMGFLKHHINCFGVEGQ